MCGFYIAVGKAVWHSLRFLRLRIASGIGFKLIPSAVREYSTRGTSAFGLQACFFHIPKLDRQYFSKTLPIDFIHRHKDFHILFLKLGVETNTPGIIQYSFLQMTAKNSEAVYACINQGEAFVPLEIEKQFVCISGNIGAVLNEL